MTFRQGNGLITYRWTFRYLPASSEWDDASANNRQQEGKNKVKQIGVIQSKHGLFLFDFSLFPICFVRCVAIAGVMTNTYQRSVVV